MRLERLLQASLMLLLVGFTSQSSAATVSYILDQSNRLEDNVDYLRVTLSDDAENGRLDFWIEPQPALTDLAGDNFGIFAFAFNVGPDVKLGKNRRHSRWGRGHRHMHDHWGNRWGRHGGRGMPDYWDMDDVLMAGDFSLPDGWRVKFNKGRGLSGLFDIRIFGGRHDGVDPLHFSIDDLTVDDISNDFAALVAGLDAPECTRGHHGHSYGCRKHAGKAIIYGGTPVDPIPVPAAFWLFGSGLLGLVGVARHKAGIR